MMNTDKTNHTIPVSQSTKTKTILLWGPEDLLCAAVRLLLTEQRGWNVIKLAEKTGRDCLVHQIESIQPDVVIMYLGAEPCPCHLPDELLMKFPNLKLITFSLENNYLEVNGKNRIWVKGIPDFLSVLDD